MTHTPHARLTPSEVKALWQQKLLNARSYLYLLAIAHRRVEWKWQIDNVSAFCEEWDIPRRTFYKAKAALVLIGLLSEKFVGSLELIPHACPPEVSVFEATQAECAQESIGVPKEAHPVPKEAHPVPKEAHLTPESVDIQSTHGSTSLKQLITPTTQSVCVNPTSEPVVKPMVKSPEVRTDVDTNDRQPAQVKKAEPPNQAKTPDKDIDPPPILLQAEKKYGINLRDRRLRQAIERWPERIEVAIACFEEKAATVKHPTRFLQKAIEENWQPESGVKKKAPSEFLAWFKEARQRGLVIGSQCIDNQIVVYTVDDRATPFEKLRQLSWDQLAAQVNAVTQQAKSVLHGMNPFTPPAFSGG